MDLLFSILIIIQKLVCYNGVSIFLFSNYKKIIKVNFIDEIKKHETFYIERSA